MAPNPSVFDHLSSCFLSVAVGGNLGFPVAPGTKFAQSMLVGYVRICQEKTP